MRAEAAKISPWTDEQVATVERLRNLKVPWESIAPEVGHSAASCSAMLSLLKKKRREGLARIKKKRGWSEHESNELIRLRGEGKRFSDIDKALGKSAGSSCGKWHSMFGPQPEHRNYYTSRQTPISRAVLLEHDSLTAKVCGDPLPGRSALDRKRAGIPDDARRPYLATGPMQSEEWAL